MSVVAKSVLQYHGTGIATDVASLACKKACGPVKIVFIKVLFDTGYFAIGGRTPTSTHPA